MIVKIRTFIYTGYYAQVNKYLNNNLAPVSISYSTPYQLKWIRNYSNLTPNGYLLKMYKNRCIDEDEYRNIYISQLDDLNREKVVDDLFMMTENKTPILLCYEKFNDFCHRHIVSNWLNMNDSISCTEFL